ncbi:MAG: diguanylate cyclase [Polyangiaceae bacterium]|nr:diguanylate cyclase [Polyangiaceae bacterium]MCW5790079.1 diguanylate cyclase [Polyangiaceae bacterium]
MDGKLSIVAIVGDPDQAALFVRVFEAAGDHCVVAEDLTEGLAEASHAVPDLVFVEVALGAGGGVALIHHLRALAPSAVIYAMAPEAQVRLAAEAVALGAAGLLVLPASGDELLTVAALVRSRIAERAQLEQVTREAEAARTALDYLARIAELGRETDRSAAARGLARLFMEAAHASSAWVYLPTSDRDRQLMCAATVGEGLSAPSFCEELELSSFAAQAHLLELPLAAGSVRSGFVLLGGTSPEQERLAAWLATQAATALAWVAEREHSHSGAMKDPSSSAYTFAYFVDVAGREIDKARRHGRRFALATISADGPGALRAEAVEQMLSAVRDTDVLARVDGGEFYLLLPETGGIGAHTCRRRVLRRGAAVARRPGDIQEELVMGVATYPHDGTDLSRLLRAAKHRADVSRRSVVKQLERTSGTLSDVLEALLWEAGAPGAEQPRIIELPQMDFLGVSVAAVTDAVRSGRTRVVVTQRSGVSVGMAVKAQLREREGVEFTAVDLSEELGLADLELMAVVAEHGSYLLFGRVLRGGVIRAVHASDPALVDWVIDRLGEAAGLRLME